MVTNIMYLSYEIPNMQFLKAMILYSQFDLTHLYEFLCHVYVIKLEHS